MLHLLTMCNPPYLPSAYLPRLHLTVRTFNFLFVHSRSNSLQSPGLHTQTLSYRIICSNAPFSLFSPHRPSASPIPFTIALIPLLLHSLHLCCLASLHQGLLCWLFSLHDMYSTQYLAKQFLATRLIHELYDIQSML